jgi:hypothetical protein
VLLPIPLRLSAGCTEWRHTYQGDREGWCRISTHRLDISYLSESTIDWGQYSLATPSIMPTHGPKSLRPHQTKALTGVREGFEQSDRGKLIMAYGTGKTFTSLKIAEDLVGVHRTSNCQRVNDRVRLRATYGELGHSTDRPTPSRSAQA